MNKVSLETLKDRWVEDELIGYIGEGVDKSIRIRVQFDNLCLIINYIVYNNWRSEKTIFYNINDAITFYNKCGEKK